MAKTKETPRRQGNSRSNANATECRTAASSRAPKEARVTKKQHGKNHKLNLTKRNVVECLLSPQRMNLFPSQASVIFNSIFNLQHNNKPVTANMLREDWATRNNKRGSNMYADRILKPAGSFTVEEIRAREEALRLLENAYVSLGASQPEQIQRAKDEDMGAPTDGIFLHPTVPLSRMPRVVVDGRIMELGWQQLPADYVDPEILQEEDGTSCRRRVRMLPGRGVHTRTRLAIVNPRTPSVTPVVQQDRFVPAENEWDSDLDAQAERRRQARARLPLERQHEYAQSQQRRLRVRDEREQERQRLLVEQQEQEQKWEQERESAKRRKLEKIQEVDEEDEEEDQNYAPEDYPIGDGDEIVYVAEDDGGIVYDEEHDLGVVDEEEEEDDDRTVRAADDLEDEDVVKDQQDGDRTVRATDDIDRDEGVHNVPESSFFDEAFRVGEENDYRDPAEASHFGHSTEDGAIPTVEGLGQDMVSLSMGDDAKPSQRNSQAAEIFERDAKTMEILYAILALPAADRIAFFKTAFPGLPDKAANQLTLDTLPNIDAAWYSLRNADSSLSYIPLFPFDEILTSSKSPLSPTFIPRMRMFHKNHLEADRHGAVYNRPKLFKIIPPTSAMYKWGGPVLRVKVPETGLDEDVMTCNDATCFVCNEDPPTDDEDYHLEGMPFVHGKSCNMKDRAVAEDGAFVNIFFEPKVEVQLGRVPLLQDRVTWETVKVTFADGFERTVALCDGKTCVACRETHVD